MEKKKKKEREKKKWQENAEKKKGFIANLGISSFLITSRQQQQLKTQEMRRAGKIWQFPNPSPFQDALGTAQTEGSSARLERQNPVGKLSFTPMWGQEQESRWNVWHWVTFGLWNTELVDFWLFSPWQVWDFPAGNQKPQLCCGFKLMWLFGALCLLRPSFRKFWLCWAPKIPIFKVDVRARRDLLVLQSHSSTQLQIFWRNIPSNIKV